MSDADSARPARNSPRRRTTAAPDQRPNILWICTDQQRWDTLGATGNSFVHTPNIDDLARSGIVFDRAYAQSPICTPSRASFMTGRYPAATRVHRNGNDYFPPEEVPVTRLLADEGYYCGLVGKLHLSRAEGRIERRPDDGFAEFHWSHDPRPNWPEGNAYIEWLRAERGVEDPQELFAAMRGLLYGEGLPEELHQTTWCGDLACDFIQRCSGETPWLLTVNTFAPHPPFLPPPSFLRDHTPREAREIPGPVMGPDDRDKHDRDKLKLLWKIDHQRGPATQAEVPADGVDVAGMRACYYGEIELLDKQVGRIIETLRETRQLENTLIVFMSDHGDMLGDHGLLLKGARLYDPLVHVPLVVSWPRLFAAQPDRVSGLRSSSLVELVDIAPTLLDAAGAEIRPSMQGESVLPLVDNASGSRRSKSQVVAEYYDALDLPHKTHASMSFDGRFKCLVYRQERLVEVFDLVEDPGEFRDLWPEIRGTQPGTEILQRHIMAYMGTTWAGPERTGPY